MGWYSIPRNPATPASMQISPPIVEWIEKPAGPFRAAMFDFDGTLSLLREDWPEIMCGMMVERLGELGTGEAPEDLHVLVEDFVMQLNGKPTIHQMERLVEEIAKRGGMPKRAEDYKGDYWNVLLARAAERMKDRNLRWMVPCIRQLLATLEKLGIELYLVSGSDLAHVEVELDFLGLTPHFKGRIFAPRGDSDGFLKRQVVDLILVENAIRPDQLLGFGDGVVETRDVGEAGGFAIGVASRSKADGRIHEAKRERLLAAGAGLIIPDYCGFTDWLPKLFGDNS